MTATHQLEATLRSLKLSGMLDTLEARLVQARAGQLGHLEFLQVLCQDQASRRAAAAVGRRLKAARFDEQVSLEEFDFTVSAKLPVATLRDLATLRFVDRSESVVLHGPVGVGKATSPKPRDSWPAATDGRSPSSKPAGHWRTWPADTPTAAGAPGYANWQPSSYSSSTTSASAP